MKKPSLFSLVTFGLLAALVASAALLAVPLTSNLIGTTKIFSVFFITAALGLVYVLYSINRKSLKLVWSPYTLPVLLFTLAMAAATFFTNTYPYENLLSMGGVVVVSGIVILLGSTMVDKQTAKLIVPTIGVTAAISAVLSGLQLAGFGPANIMNSLFGLNLPANLIFNLAGSPFVAVQFMLVALAGLVARSFYTKHISVTTAVSVPLIVIGLLINGWVLLPGKIAELRLPSYTASWSVALDTIRSPRAALIGAGPASYGNVYSRFKPVWMNATDTWNITYNSASNAPLHMLTVGGFLLLAAWAVLSFKLLLSPKRTTANKDMAVMLAATVVLQLVFPANIVLLVLQAVLLTLFIAAEKGVFPVLNLRALTISVVKDGETGTPKSGALTAPVYIMSALLFAGFAFGTYLAARAYAAEMYLYRGNMAMVENNGVEVYEQHQKAVQMNPYIDGYRRQYALTNLLVATALAEKQDLSQAEQTQVVQLLQQGVREARAAALLDPTDTQNHQVLARIYQNMIGLAEGADQWTQQAYVSAINYSPTDPALRVALGGLFLQLEQPQSALNLFNQAAELKPDYANAYYNGANVLVQLEQYLAADAAYQTLLQILPPDSEQYAQVMQERDAIKDEVEAALAAQQQAQQAANPNAAPQEQEAPAQPNLTEEIINQGEPAPELENNPTQDDLNVDAVEVTPNQEPAPENPAGPAPDQQ